MIGILASIGLNLFYSVDTDGTPAVAATGTLTFTGNVTTGELVNITNGGVHTFEFNTTGTGTSSSTYINVDVSGSNNTSVIASGKLTDAINANASTAAQVTAVNTTNVTTLTAVTAGTAGNSIGTTDTVTNAAFGSATLTGGIAAIDGWGTTTVLIWAFIAIIATACLILQLMKDIGVKIDGR